MTRKEGRKEGIRVMKSVPRNFSKKTQRKVGRKKSTKSYAFRHMVEKVQFEERPWVTKELRSQEVALIPLEV